MGAGGISATGGGAVSGGGWLPAQDARKTVVERTQASRSETLVPTNMGEWIDTVAAGVNAVAAIRFATLARAAVPSARNDAARAVRGGHPGYAARRGGARSRRPLFRTPCRCGTSERAARPRGPTPARRAPRDLPRAR